MEPNHMTARKPGPLKNISILSAAIQVGLSRVEVVAILNDTTGTLVAGAHDYPDCAIGLILGNIYISYSDMSQAPS